MSKEAYPCQGSMTKSSRSLTQLSLACTQQTNIEVTHMSPQTLQTVSPHFFVLKDRNHTYPPSPFSALSRPKPRRTQRKEERKKARGTPKQSKIASVLSPSPINSWLACRAYPLLVSREGSTDRFHLFCNSVGGEINHSIIPCFQRYQLSRTAMFAPPPVSTLSRAEIQAKRAELRAKRASSTGGSSFNSTNELQLTRTSDSAPAQPAPKPKKSGRFTSSSGGGVEEIREADKETWKFKKPKLGSKKGKLIKDGGSGISLPATLLPPPPPPPGPPSLRSDAGSYVESIVEESSLAERRDKPAPPKRPARPSGELFLSPPLSAAMSDSFPRALTPESFAGSSFRSASASPATPPPFQPPPSVPGAYPMMATVKAGSPRPPPLPSPPMPSPPMLSGSPMPTGPASPPPSTPPPPIPERSPLRQQRPARPSSNPATSKTPKLDAHRKQQAMSSDAALSSAMAELRMAMKDPITIGQGEQQFPPQPLQEAKEPEELSILTGIQPLQVRKATKSPAKSLLRSGTGSSKAIAGGEKESSATSPARPIVAVSKAQRIAKQGLRRQAATHRRGNLGVSVRLARAQKKPRTPIVSPQPRKGNGETLALLQTSDIYPDVNEVVHSEIPASASFVDRDLPDTPNSIAPTPTKLYEHSHAPFGESRNGRKNGGTALRSPLSVVSDTNAKSNSTPAPPNAASDGLPHRLATIQEYKPFSENSPLPSGTATPVATQIHLRGGSVVTVTPPELTAWQRSIYIHGSIRLPKPVILPRKNSVASMEPFQEAIDRVYQDALFVPRRRSDDAVLDDVCEFFDDFGFDDIGSEGGLLAVERPWSFDGDEMMDVDELDGSMERFTTPPGFQSAGDVSPIERLVAKDVVEASMSKPLLSPIILEPNVPLPPVETEETLRARGIARLSQLSTGRSSTSSRSSSYRKDKPILSRRTSDSTSPIASGSRSTSMLPLLPAPESSMLDSVTEASHGEEGDWVEEMIPDGDAGGMDWSDDDLEETDAGVSWTSPAVKHKKKHGLDRGYGKESRNPVAKMRRFVATATTIL